MFDLFPHSSAGIVCTFKSTNDDNNNNNNEKRKRTENKVVVRSCYDNHKQQSSSSTDFTKKRKINWCLLINLDISVNINQIGLAIKRNKERKKEEDKKEEEANSFVQFLVKLSCHLLLLPLFFFLLLHFKQKSSFQNCSSFTMTSILKIAVFHSTNNPFYLNPFLLLLLLLRRSDKLKKNESPTFVFFFKKMMIHLIDLHCKSNSIIYNFLTFKSIQVVRS